MKMKSFVALAIWLAMVSVAAAQQSQIAATIQAPGTITTGGTFQAMPLNLGSSVNSHAARRSLTVQNNNTSTNNCWLFIGSGTATTGKSILLTPGQGYTRYWPYVPSDALQITCVGTGDTFYADYQ
jgi:hypothetical protein